MAARLLPCMAALPTQYGCCMYHIRFAAAATAAAASIDNWEKHKEPGFLAFKTWDWLGGK